MDMRVSGSVKHLVFDEIKKARNNRNDQAVDALERIMDALNHLRDDRIAGYDDRIFIIHHCNQRIKYQRKEIRRLLEARHG